MKKLSIIFVLIIFSRFAFAVCDTSARVVITAPADTICAGDSVEICAAMGYVTYAWNTGDTSVCILAMVPGNYNVTVTDTSGCTITSNYLTISIYPASPVTISVDGDTLTSYNAVTYQWCLNGILIPGATSATYIANASGSYSLEITDSHGCEYHSAPANITGNPQYSLSLGPNQTVCSGSQITLEASITAGTPPYTYSWNSTGNTLSCYTCANPVVTLTQNATFTVTVTDAINQTVSATVSYSVSGSGSLPRLSLASTNISCAQPVDTTTAAISGGAPPYIITWGDGVIAPDSFSSAIHNYAQAGIYVVTLSDSLGCVTSALDTVQDNGVILTVVQQTNPPCATSTIGTIMVAASGGTAPYTYLWNTGGTTDSLFDVPSQYYSVTVTDFTGCSFTQTYPLWALDGGFYVYMNTGNINCANNGSINLTPNGGVPPYQYSWSNGVTTQNLANLSAGPYNVTVTDSLGCIATGTTYLYSSCFSYITGVVFADTNSNCVFDSSEQPASGIIVMATGNSGQTFYGCSGANGNYSIGVDATGTYSLTASYSYYGLSCGNITLCGDSSQTVTIDTLGDTLANNNFAFVGSTGFDLTIHPGWTSADPGFQKEYWVMPYNTSYTPFNGTATVVFTYDSNLIYQSSLPPLPTVDLAAHTLTWLVDSVPYPIFDWYNLRFQNFFLVPANLSLSYLLQSSFSITPTAGDCDSANNFMSFSEVVTGSHDPNEKTVEPAGQLTENDSVLTYTIHFQNTGTDSTFFIVVLDTLSPNLNPATVRNLASSNKYSDFSISGKGILKWTFNPLRLPDSAASPAGSKGFITFSVNRVNNLPQGTPISNTASVYFDYNQPVQTNAVADTVGIPAAVTDIHSNQISVTAFPNPFADATNIIVKGINEQYGFELYDVTGQLVKVIDGIRQNQFKVNRDELPSAIYFYRLTVASKQVAYGKLVVE